jgi:predicted dienelactone hydrolase
MVSPFPRRRKAGSLPSLLALALAAATGVPPAAALDTLKVELPVLQVDFSIELGELESPRELIAGSSDLAELDRATGGQVGRRFLDLFNTPLPSDLTSAIGLSAGQPLMEQALLGLSWLVQVEDMPADTSGHMLTDALLRAQQAGQPTLLGFLREIPGNTARVNLSRAITVARRLRRQQQEGRDLVQRHAASSSDPALHRPGPVPWQRRSLRLEAPHRPEPIDLRIVAPADAATSRQDGVVVISHGLWDSPESFGGWAEHLASHGYTVLLPVHQGSDSGQQSAMLAGRVPPPSPEELRLRPEDVTVVLDALAAGRLPVPRGLRSDRVAVIGHSWGGATALQLAGAQTSDRQLAGRCDDLRDPQRNLSWTLQCSFLSSVARSALADPRVATVIAVSPIAGLLFAPAPERAGDRPPILLVSGTSDWVVPSGPEALEPFRRSGAAALGHRLVLAGGGDHFNLRAPEGQGGTPLAGLLLAWLRHTLPGRGEDLPTPWPTAGWGDEGTPLVDVTSALLP